MNRRKSHIAFLAFMMLVLFVSPIAVKAVHHHLTIQIALSDPQKISISAAKDTCPVCQFEFVTFIAFDNQDYIPESLLSSFDGCEPTIDIQGSSLAYCSLRAPPVS
jgi:hypothetical protein